MFEFKDGTKYQKDKNKSMQSGIERGQSFVQGPFKYYVSKKVGGWGMPNAYVFLHGGWVGLARCLRNQKKLKKGKTKKKKVENIAIKYPRNKKVIRFI